MEPNIRGKHQPVDQKMEEPILMKEPKFSAALLAIRKTIKKTKGKCSAYACAMMCLYSQQGNH